MKWTAAWFISLPVAQHFPLNLKSQNRCQPRAYESVKNEFRSEKFAQRGRTDIELYTKYVCKYKAVNN